MSDEEYSPRTNSSLSTRHSDIQRMMDILASLEESARLERERNDRLEKELEERARLEKERTDRLEKELDEIRRNRNVGGHSDSEQEAEWADDSPFTSQVRRRAVPRGFKLPPSFKQYDGQADPEDHLTMFNATMKLSGASDATKCWAFPLTLTDSGLLWFSNLEPQSINCFTELAGRFIQQFSSNKRVRKPPASLATVKQRSGETLRKYLIRLDNEAAKIKGLTEGEHLMALLGGVREGTKFHEYVTQKPPETLSLAREKARGFVDVEEKAGGKISERRVREHRSPSPRRDYNRNRGDRDYPPRRKGRNERVNSANERTTRAPLYHDYTNLTAPRGDIFTENKDLFRLPPTAGRSRIRADADPSTYCIFHQTSGHLTEDCVLLKDEIERLVRLGDLREYVRRNRSRSPQRGSQSTRQVRGVIDYIAGGPAVGGLSKTGRKRIRRVMTAGQRIADLRTRRPRPVIHFSNEDYKFTAPNYDEPMVISAFIADYQVKKILVDQGSSADVMYFPTFEKLGLKEEQLSPYPGTLVGFSGEEVPVRGLIELEAEFGESPNTKTIHIEFLVVGGAGPYNVILGRPSLNRLEAVVSTLHLVMKFPASDIGVGVVYADREAARTCYDESLRQRESPSTAEVRMVEAGEPLRAPLGSLVPLVDIDPRADFHNRPEPADIMEEVLLGPTLDRVTYVASDLPADLKAELVQLLQRNKDLFAWTPAEMPGIDPEVMCHTLSVSPTAKPVAQKPRKQGNEKGRAAEEETKKLMAAGFIREIRYTTWLSNVVLVKKANGKWRMCTDYTNLNKACPKDGYPLPNIDRLVDKSAGYNLLSFMDAFSGYNQIRMHPSDAPKTAFITELGNYFYEVMPFGLKNAGATYQRLMNKVFKDQIGKTMEVYVDDMVVKSTQGERHTDVLAEAFDRMRIYSMRLNPLKCAFGVRGGKFLGFLLTERGIEANPDKCNAIIDMRSPTSPKEVQKLTGRIAALSRFVAKAGERSIPFFRLLRKTQRFEWTPECEAAFQELKSFLASPPILSKPVDCEPLILYLATSEEAVSAVLVREDGKQQMPVYFVSKTLHGPEVRYQRVEKVVLALVMAARKLRQYFHSHPIIVRTDQPIRQIIQKPDLAGRMISWAVELSEFDISFESREAIKSQALADFAVELIGSTEPLEASQSWVLYVDGASNKKGCGAGVLLESPVGITVELSLKLNFQVSNNQAEYEALIAGLKLAKEMGAPSLIVHSDSQLIINQVSGEYAAKDPQLARYQELVSRLVVCFDKVVLNHIPREQNERADVLSKLASSKRTTNNRTLIQEVLDKPSTLQEVLAITSAPPDWQTPIREYLTSGLLPSDRSAAKKIQRSASFFTMIGDDLYKRGFSMPLLRCIRPTEEEEIMSEVHEGVCGNHCGGRTLAAKILRAGYYWPKMRQQCMEYVRKCDKCQRFADAINRPAGHLHPMEVSWPFHAWGIDILGPFTPAPGQLKFLVVAVDYFTKWIEAEPLANITAARIKRFIWKNLICRFGAPRELVTDNGTQFTNRKLKALCDDLGIEQKFTSVEHPQTNGQAEAANKIILTGLRRRLSDAKGKWASELPSVLWAYHTTPQSSTRETPFRLVFGAEAMIPIEVGFTSLRRKYFDEHDNEYIRAAELDLLQEERDTAHVREIAAKQRAARKYNKKVIRREFKEGDLVLRKLEPQRQPQGEGKLAAKWEGPFRVTRVLGNGAYHLARLDGRALPRSWNADSLKIYYS